MASPARRLVASQAICGFPWHGFFLSEGALNGINFLNWFGVYKRYSK